MNGAAGSESLAILSFMSLSKIIKHEAFLDLAFSLSSGHNVCSVSFFKREIKSVSVWLDLLSGVQRRCGGGNSRVCKFKLLK